MPAGKNTKTSDISIPATIRRSPPKARRTYAKAKASAERRYGAGERAARTAMAALKHGYEKVGDHWERKSQPGPSDDRAKSARRRQGRTAGGVDVIGNTRQELYERARALDVRGRSRMNKQELGEAIARRQ